MVVENAQIALVARFADEMVFDSLQDCATRLVAMGTIAEAAVFRRAEDFRKVVGDFDAFHIDGTEAFDARRINQVATPGEGYHLGERRRVHPLVMVFRYVSGPKSCARHQLVDYRRFPYARMPREQRNLIFQICPERIQSFLGTRT